MRLTITLIAQLLAVLAAVVMFYLVPWAIHNIDSTVVLPGWFPWLVAYISYESDVVKISTQRGFADFFGKNPKRKFWT